MGTVNWNRVILGGLVAGLIINICEFLVNGLWLEKDWAAVMTSLGKTGQMGPEVIVAFNVWGFVMGIVAVWLYAAIRPRYGAGPKTAAIAACAVWIIGYFLAGVAPVITGLFPRADDGDRDGCGPGGGADRDSPGRADVQGRERSGFHAGCGRGRRSLIREADLFEKFTKTRIGADRIEQGVGLERHEAEIACGVGLVQEFKRLLPVAEANMDRC